jgi:hypothetical protein
MITGADFVWMHFPKCAGSTTESILWEHLSERDDVSFDEIDPKGPVIWHDSIADRRRRDPRFQVGNRRVLANIRRLPYWVISIVHYERQRSTRVTRRERLLRGEYMTRIGEVGKADRLAAKYSCHPVNDWVRTEHLAADLKGIFPSLPDSIASVPRVNEGKHKYIPDLNFWFTPKELGRLYERNPVWALLEERVYGDIMTI